jgi:hypothetical protein
MGVRLTGDIGALRALADRLERAGRRGALGEAVWRVIVPAIQPLREEARAHARAILPRRGGLGALVAQTPMPITTRDRGRWKGVRVDARPGAVKDPGRIDRGRIRHPVFGREPKDGEPILQNVQAGWFTVPMTTGAEKTRAAVRAAIDEEIRRLS